MKSKYNLLLVLMLLCTAVHARKGAFLRMYDIKGHKFTKGYFVATTDSSILIYKHHTTINIMVMNIGYIRKGRSAGHDILIIGLSVALPFTIIGAIAAAANEVTAAGGAGAGFVF